MQTMTQKEAAEYITRVYKKMDPSTLSRLTNNGGGPPFKRIGKQKHFEKSDVDSWIVDRMSDESDDE